MCKEATAAFLKVPDPKAAVDACIILNQWALGVELAEQFKMPQIEGLLSQYTSHLLQKDQHFQVCQELFRISCTASSFVPIHF